MDATRQRILEATYACVARWGLAKTTVEDVAREAKRVPGHRLPHISRGDARS